MLQVQISKSFKSGGWNPIVIEKTTRVLGRFPGTAEQFYSIREMVADLEARQNPSIDFKLYLPTET